MFTRYDKAGAAAIGGAIATILSVATALTPDQIEAWKMIAIGLLSTVLPAIGAYWAKYKE